MTDNDYSNALTAAEKELEALSNQAAVIERRRAQLQQTISALRTLTNVAEDEERTLTETIRIVVKGAQAHISAADVLKGVQAMGVTFSGKNPLSSVVTILARLHKAGELAREISGSGYIWAGYLKRNLPPLSAVPMNTPGDAWKMAVDRKKAHESLNKK
ncbi:MAG TPA: hypothetical protein VNX26_17405 [Candidatus Acidoferrum sp.]|jgi:hypothetical protein|nr:hypothetical protein [Candidatus Acidoferrum sp.]